MARRDPVDPDDDQAVADYAGPDGSVYVYYQWEDQAGLVHDASRYVDPEEAEEWGYFKLRFEELALEDRGSVQGAVALLNMTLMPLLPIV